MALRPLRREQGVSAEFLVTTLVFHTEKKNQKNINDFLVSGSGNSADQRAL